MTRYEAAYNEIKERWEVICSWNQLCRCGGKVRNCEDCIIKMGDFFSLSLLKDHGKIKILKSLILLGKEEEL